MLDLGSMVATLSITALGFERLVILWADVADMMMH
jgi:hypothetical protein